MIRRLENFVSRYGPEAGPVLFHVLQSQAAHAGVSKRLRHKLGVLEGRIPATVKEAPVEPLPLFPNIESEEAAELVAVAG